MDVLTLTLAGVLVSGAPLVLAVLGETLTERAGVINLSLDGTILLAAMVGFAAAVTTDNAWLGWLAAGLVGLLTAAILALVGLVLERSQLAVGFILTLLCRDLAYFLGHPFSRRPGPSLDVIHLPGLSELPFIGAVLGRHSAAIYISLLLIPAVWYYLNRTEAGLALRAVGESPRAAYGRGINVRRTRILYTLAGGFMVGLAGGAFSLAVKLGWGRPQGCEGAGWIALAIVIFGGWNPVRAAAGAYFFALLQVAGIHLQDVWTGIPAPVFQVAPFPVMIIVLLFVNLGQTERLQDVAYRHPQIKAALDRLRVTAPAALGREFNPDKDL